jgi:pimeloyl-ACP methyl ester carboxylesterase
MQALAEAAPDGLFVGVRDAGHLSPMESPAAVSSALLDFLARLG